MLKAPVCVELFLNRFWNPLHQQLFSEVVMTHRVQQQIESGIPLFVWKERLNPVFQHQALPFQQLSQIRQPVRVSRFCQMTDSGCQQRCPDLMGDQVAGVFCDRRISASHCPTVQHIIQALNLRVEPKFRLWLRVIEGKQLRLLATLKLPPLNF